MMEGIKDILGKISSYNIFNYLLPGILFVFLTKEIIGYNLIQDNILIGAFLYYFIGMVISRFGSLLIEPLLKKVKFIKFTDYKDFVIASKKDTKIELLSEVNNSYRTILSVLVLIILLRGYVYLQNKWTISNDISILLMVLFVLFLFLFSYRKQTNYITKRVDINNRQ